ncbi:MAG: hypothetical protein HUU21_18005, partial [Polyangiaceae bacterium]|nr:hypothetical protein [Polyangiaceae bacterium]
GGGGILVIEQLLHCGEDFFSLGIALGPAPRLRADLGENARELMPGVEACLVEELDELLGCGEHVVTAFIGGHEFRGFLKDGRVDAGSLNHLGGEAEDAFDGDLKARSRLGELADLVGEEVDGLDIGRVNVELAGLGV